jgi:hypothetical protein
MRQSACFSVQACVRSTEQGQENRGDAGPEDHAAGNRADRLPRRVGEQPDEHEAGRPQQATARLEPETTERDAPGASRERHERPRPRQQPGDEHRPGIVPVEQALPASNDNTSPRNPLEHLARA